MNIKDYIASVPDFPKKGIIFRDITTACKDAKALKYIIEYLTEQFKDKKIDYIAAVESRGFVFGSALACNINAGLVLIRKPGKLPAEVVSQDYQLEYGTDKIEMHKDAIEKGKRVLIIDDLFFLKHYSFSLLHRNYIQLLPNYLNCSTIL